MVRGVHIGGAGERFCGPPSSEHDTDRHRIAASNEPAAAAHGLSDATTGVVAVGTDSFGEGRES